MKKGGGEGKKEGAMGAKCDSERRLRVFAREGRKKGEKEGRKERDLMAFICHALFPG